MGIWQRELIAWETYMLAIGTPDTTLQLRLYHLRRLAADVPKTPATLTFDDLVAWFAGQSWAQNTRKSYRQSFRSFYAWAMATGRVRESPAHLLPPVRVPRGKPRPTPELDYQAAIAKAAPRERLALRLAGVCGLRRSEVARARREDVEVDLLGHSLRVTGKGGHVRLVPLPADLAAEVLAMPDGWLFPSPHGGHLTPHHLAKCMSAVLGHNPHSLRHRAGTRAYQGTKDLRAVQEFLGHAKPETTAIYTEVAGADVRAAMNAAAA